MNGWEFAHEWIGLVLVLWVATSVVRSVCRAIVSTVEAREQTKRVRLESGRP